jgi:hypothetical protein
VGDRDGRLRELGRNVQQLRRPEALVEGIVRLQEKIKAGVPPAYEIRGVAS